MSLCCGLLFFPVTLSFINVMGLGVLLLSFTVHSLIKAKLLKKTLISQDERGELEIFMTDLIPPSYKSVLVFIKNGKEWLMVKNKNRSWEFPGGHRENNETLYETAKREAYEEAGVDIKGMVYKGYYRLPNGHTTAIVTAEVEKFHEIPSDFETEERRFVAEFPASLSFNDAVYPWLVRNLC